MVKKGQAAMEFLMTYGWAILAAIVAIGILYVIIGNPQNLVGDRFDLSAPFVAGAKSASTSGVTIEFRNGAGESVNVTSVAITNCGTTSDVGSVADGTLKAVTVACTLTSGDRIKGDVAVNYRTTGSNVTQKATGSVNLKVA